MFFYDNNSVSEIAQSFSENNTDIIYDNLDYINENGKVIRN